MSIAAAPAHLLTIEEWHDRYATFEGRCELVRGRTIMSPTEATQNSRATTRLILLLGSRLGASWEPLTNTSVVIRHDPRPTVRVPDLVLLRSDRVGPEWRMLPADIVLVAEVVSPSSLESDWVTKQEEYAAAGIPNYLVVDVRFDTPRVWLFDRRVAGEGSEGSARDGEPTTYARYEDPAGDGTAVTIRIPGADPITITAADLR